MKAGAVLALGAAVAAPLAAGVLFTEELYRYVFMRNGSPLLSRFLDKKGHEEDYYFRRDSAAAQLREKPCHLYTIESARGERLQGYYYPAAGEGRRIAFLIHGYRSEHAETAGLYYAYYVSRGFDLFCCDNTAHGASQGQRIGFDVYESEDCLRWLDFLLERFGTDVQIVLHGFSMGASTVMKMSDRCPANVRFLVEDSGFMDGREQLRGQLGAMYAPLSVLHALRACNLSRSDVRPNLDRSRLPLLIVHGQQDTTVPFANGPALLNYYQGERDSLFAENARHIETMLRSRRDYEAKLDAFIRRYVK